MGMTGFGASAQTYWSLNQCVEYALTNNLQVNQAEMQSKSTGEVLKNTRAQALPNLNGFATNIWNFGQTIDPLTNTFATQSVRSNQFGVSSSVDLYRGGQYRNSVKRDQYNLEAARHDLDKMRNDITLMIANAYLSTIMAEELLTVAQNQVMQTKTQTTRIKKLVDAGSAPRGDLLNIEAQLASEEMQLVSSQNQVDLNYLGLLQLLQIDSIPDFRVIKPELNIDEGSGLLTTPGQIYDQALRVLPEIKASESRVQSSERALQLAKGARYPTLSLSGSVGTGYSGARRDFITGELLPFDQQLSENLNQSVGFRLNVPIFNNLGINTAVSRAEINQDLTKSSLEIAKNDLNQTIRRAYADAKAAYNQYLAAKKALDASQESFKYTEQRYNVGMLNVVDYNAAKVAVASAQSDLLRAKYDYIFKVKILDVYQGKPITLQ